MNLNTFEYHVGDVVQLADGTYDIIESMESNEADNSTVCPPLMSLRRLKHGCKQIITKDEIQYVVTGTNFCVKNQILLVNNVDDLSWDDWCQFTSGFRSWSVHKKCMNDILLRCSALGINWDGDESATSFNPFEAYEHLSEFQVSMLELLGTALPNGSNRCLLCVHGKYLMFTFNQEMFE